MVFTIVPGKQAILYLLFLGGLTLFHGNGTNLAALMEICYSKMLGKSEFVNLSIVMEF